MSGPLSAIIDAHGKNDTQQKNKAAMEAIPPEFFTEFDATRYLLEKLPEQISQDYVESQLEIRRRALQIVNAQLAEKVMNKYGQFVSGMTKVQEFETELQMTSIICSNGRRALQKALDRLTKQGLIVVNSWRQKKTRMEIINSVELIKSVLEGLTSLSQALTICDYPTAIQICLRHRSQMSTLKQYSCLNNYIEKLQDFAAIEKEMERSLRRTCSEFDQLLYERVIAGYKLLGGEQSIGDRIHAEMLESLRQLARNVVQSIAMHGVDFTLVEQIKSAQYMDMCSYVKPENLYMCAQQLCYELTNVMRSHHDMQRFHKSASSDDKVYNDIKAKLMNGRVGIWSEMQWHLGVLILAAATERTTVEQFLQLYELTDKFLQLGEIFSESEGHHLRGSLKHLMREFFGKFHKARCEDIRTLIETESWRRIPVDPKFTPRDLPDIKALLKHATTPQKPAQPVSSKHLFDGPNPFTREPSSRRQPPPKPAKPASGTHPPLPPKPGAAKHRHAADDSDDEAAELKQDRIVDTDDGDVPATTAAAAAAHTKTQSSDSAPMVVATSMNLARDLARYLQLMQTLQPIAVEIYTGMQHLFEYYLFCVMTFFSSSPIEKPLITEARKSISLRLSTSLQRMERGIVHGETQDDTPGNAYPRIPRHVSVDLSRPHNLYGLPERVVATESLQFLSDVFAELRPSILALLPHSQHTSVIEYFSSTVDSAVKDLRYYIYRVVSCLLIDFEPFIAKVAATKYDMSEIGVKHSPYVDALVEQFTMMNEKLVGVASTEVRNILFEYCIINAMDAIVDGLSKVKKCSNSGRALMMMDMNEFCSSMKRITKMKQIPKRGFLEEYIKAYYLPLPELMEWVHMHQEYRKEHHVGLFLSGVGSGMKKSQQQEYVKSIESFYESS